MAEKDVSELIRKLEGATTPEELQEMGACFVTNYGNLAIYWHPAFPEKDIIFRREIIDGTDGEEALAYQIMKSS